MTYASPGDAATALGWLDAAYAASAVTGRSLDAER